MRQHATTAPSIGRIKPAPAWGHRSAIQVLVRVVLMLLVLEAVVIVVFRLQVRPGIDAIRRFNRAVLNPAMMKLAGSCPLVRLGDPSSRPSLGTVLRDACCRRAGRQPVLRPAAVWPYRLVRQRDGCGRMRTIEHRGKLYHAAAPMIVPFADAAPVISARSLRSFRLYNVRSFLRLDITGEE